MYHDLSLQVILSQEKRIYVLNELVKTLQQQLAQCQENSAENTTDTAFESRTHSRTEILKPEEMV